MNRVSAILFNAPVGVQRLADGGLTDVAPTLPALMGQPEPADMTGQSLLRGTPREQVMAVPAAMRQETARKEA